MLAPPGIRLRNPEGVETGLLTGFGHGDGFVHRLHAELQDSDIEGNCHKDQASNTDFRRRTLKTQFLDFGSQFSDVQSGSFHECSNPLISSHTALFNGVGTPNLLPHFTIAPFMKSTSVWRLARTSCNMLARCWPGALAPFCTSCRGSPWSAIPNFFATASPSAIRSLNSSPVGSKRAAAP